MYIIAELWFIEGFDAVIAKWTICETYFISVYIFNVLRIMDVCVY